MKNRRYQAVVKTEFAAVTTCDLVFHVNGMEPVYKLKGFIEWLLLKSHVLIDLLGFPPRSSFTVAVVPDEE